MPKKRKFNPEGSGYDYESARKAGLGANKTGHWPSRVPGSGLILKGAGHKTYNRTVGAEKRLGNAVFKHSDGRYYSGKLKSKVRKKIKQ